MGARPFGRVEGEDVGRGVAIGQSGHGVHESLGEVFRLARIAVHHHDHAVALAHGNAHGVLQSLIILVAHLELVDHHLDVVVLVSVYLHAARNLLDLAVDTDIEVALLAHALEELTVMALALAHEWGEDVDGMSGIVGEDHVDDLLLGVFHHLLAAQIAISRGRPRVEEAQVIVYLGGRSHGRPRIFVGGFLLNADHGRQSRDLVDVGALQVAEEVACVGRERLDVSPLSFGVDGVEGERRLARPRQAGDDG